MPYKKRPLIIAAEVFVFLFAILFQITGIIDISIKNATPLILLPLVTAFSVYSSFTWAAVAGFVSGACLDSVMTGAYCFNTILFTVIAVAVYLISNNLFNKNIQSAIALSLITGVFYFVLKWAVFYAFKLSVQDSMTYLLSYAFPSVVYTAVFIFPFYYLFKYFDKIN